MSESNRDHHWGRAMMFLKRGSGFVALSYMRRAAGQARLTEKQQVLYDRLRRSLEKRLD